MPDRAAPPSSIKNKIMVAFILVIVAWGIVNSLILERALHTILIRERLPDSVIENIARNFTMLSTGLTIAGVLVFHIIAQFLARHIALPIKKLTNGVISLANGRLDVQIEVANQDEIGQLADTFNGMVRDLRETTVSREYLNSVIESMINTLMVVTPDARIQTVNQALLELLGYTEAEVTGRPVGTILAEEGLASRLLHDLANFAPLCNVETNYRSKCGEKIPVSFSSSLLRQRDGKVHGIVCVAQDVTEQKRTEKSLQQSKAELLVKHEELMNLFHQMEKVKGEWEQTMDCVGDMVILADQEGRIKRCNKAVLELAGKSQQEILDKTWKEVLFGFEVDANACYDLGLELFHKATSRWFELKHYPFKEMSDSRISGMVITIHDTTEMKKITDALEKAYVDLAFSQTKIVQQEKMASIGLLAAGVAHEINNPLGFIKCNLGMLDQYWVALVNFIQFQSRTIASIGGAEILAKAAEQRQELDVDHIMQDANELIMESLDGAERVRRIVQDLKTFSRMDNAESITANINECLASAVNIVWNELKYKATLKREYGDIPSTRCFPQQLNQVFMNLLVNAAHAIEKHGEIALRTWHADGSIFASVSDTGRGIPEDQQNRVFEPFFTTKVVGEGTGLGLSITYDIIKKHNGEITVKSTVGCGTTFTVRIPVVEGA